MSDPRCRISGTKHLLLPMSPPHLWKSGEVRCVSTAFGNIREDSCHHKKWMLQESRLRSRPGHGQAGCAGERTAMLRARANALPDAACEPLSLSRRGIGPSSAPVRWHHEAERRSGARAIPSTCSNLINRWSSSSYNYSFWYTFDDCGMARLLLCFSQSGVQEW
jgi:hypothetical protein